MIKNLLYSLFLHFLLLVAIYANFNLKRVEENNLSEIAVSLIAINGDDSSNKSEPSSDSDVKNKVDEETKNEPIKKIMSQKKSPKNRAKKQPKKIAKLKPTKSISKPIEENKDKEFKQNENLEQNQKEDDSTKKEEQLNENQDEEQDETHEKEKEFGSQEIEKEEHEKNDVEKTAKNNSSNLANNLENLDLSAREKFNIQSQLKRCYRRAMDETKLKSKIKIMVKITISEDGYIDSDLEETLDAQHYNDPSDPSYKISIDNVRRALDLCSPLRNLPLDKYDIWKEIVLEFDEE